MPEISVIVPNYNHASYLKIRIDSILNQSFQDFEIIILDDNSNDNSREVIEGYRENPKVSAIVFNDVNSGSAFVQWYKGIHLAAGKYVWIAESDDFADNNFLEVAMKAMKESRCDLFFCRSVQVDEGGRFLRNLDWWLDDLDPDKWKKNYLNSAVQEIRHFLIFKNFICNASSVLFVKDDRAPAILEGLADFKYCGDWLFWLKYLESSTAVSYSIDTTNYWRDHAMTTRAAPAQIKNIEVLKIYRWIVSFILKSESLSLLRYYYRVHINKRSRKYIVEHLNLMKHGSRYSSLLLFVIGDFFIRPKRYLL